MSTPPASLNRLSSIILFVTVVVAPLPFGSVEPEAAAVWCILLGFAVAALSPRLLNRSHLPVFGIAAIVIFAFGFVLHEQLASTPWIAPTDQLWRTAAEALGTPPVSSVSIARSQPLFSLGAPLANTLALICSFVVCLERDRARQLLVIIAWSGAAYAIYGIAAYVIDPTFVLWREKTAYRDSLTATFINRNTAATYFGSCAILWLLLVCQRLRQRLPPGYIYWRKFLFRLLVDTPRPFVVPSTMLILCVVATLMTNSRAGIVLSLAALVIAFVAYFHRDLPRRGGIPVALAVGSLVALLAIQVLGGGVSGRFNEQGLSGEGRLETYRSTIAIIKDHPWFGTGLGTFKWIYPAYRSGKISTWGVWTRAHSTPLELASDLGLPLAGLVVAVWVALLGLLARAAYRTRHDRIVPVAALTVAVLGLTHSTIDFSLQIPGFAIIVFALAGAGLARALPSNNKFTSQ
jgi:O-antigen ligase